jgi:hypothetical protein
MDTADCFRHERAHRETGDLRKFLVFRLQDGVRNDKFFNARRTNSIDGGSREDGMDAARLDTTGARVLEGLGDIWGRAALVNNSQAGVEPPCEGACTVNASGVRRYDNRVFNRVIKGANILLKHRHGKHVVNRNVEKALNLAGMQLERCLSPDPGGLGSWKSRNSVSQSSGGQPLGDLNCRPSPRAFAY